MNQLISFGFARACVGFLTPLATLAAALLLTGCATPADPRDDAKFQSYASTTNRPVVRPVRSVSNFSDSLMCMDYLFREAQIPTTLVTSKQIPDFSTRVPVATKDMIITALSQMSRLSNAFRYVDYEVDIARQDTVQNLTTILLNNNQMQLQRPALYFSGAIAFVDQNVINNRFEVGTAASRLDTGYSRTRNATIIGLELHLGDFRTRTLIPGLDSANEVIIASGGQGLDLAGRIGSYGVQFNVGRDSGRAGNHRAGWQMGARALLAVPHARSDAPRLPATIARLVRPGLAVAEQQAGAALTREPRLSRRQRRAAR